jgi:Pet100
MVKGRQGFMLEGWKFGVYLLVPLTASIYYNSPENQKKSADYWQYVTYPANPSTGWKDQIELLQSQKEQRRIYRQQLERLNGLDSAAEHNTTPITSVDTVNNTSQIKNSRSWLRWVGIGPKKDTEE